MTRAFLTVVRATIVASLAALVACTANVQDLGTPEKPVDPPKPSDEACIRASHGSDCAPDGPLTCNPSSTLQCVCGVDGKWVCLDASLGLLSPHALGDFASCAPGVTYEDATSLCACDAYGQLACMRPKRQQAPSEHAP
jgi:hypothetical protein